MYASLEDNTFIVSYEAVQINITLVSLDIKECSNVTRPKGIAAFDTIIRLVLVLVAVPSVVCEMDLLLQLYKQALCMK